MVLLKTNNLRVQLCLDQTKLNTSIILLFNLPGLLSVIVVSGQSGKVETESLEPTMVEQTKEFLRKDGITLKDSGRVFELNFEPELRALMHMF